MNKLYVCNISNRILDFKSRWPLISRNRIQLTIKRTSMWCEKFSRLNLSCWLLTAAKKICVLKTSIWRWKTRICKKNSSSLRKRKPILSFRGQTGFNSSKSSVHKAPPSAKSRWCLRCKKSSQKPENAPNLTKCCSSQHKLSKMRRIAYFRKQLKCRNKSNERGLVKL